MLFVDRRLRSWLEHKKRKYDNDGEFRKEKENSEHVDCGAGELVAIATGNIKVIV